VLDERIYREIKGYRGRKCERENAVYILPEKELGGLSPNLHIHVSMSDLYIPRIGPHIFLQQNRQADL
jgi:hypothetical protein